MTQSEYRMFAEQSIVNRGNRSRIQGCMRRALAGCPITIGFLGGSITQGSLSSSSETCYAYLVFEWWKKKFPASRMTYVNAGVGGTTSQFGVARVKQDLLAKNPDFSIVEFSVNDDPTDFFEETYEGLLRTILKSSGTSVLILHNVRYDTGVSAEKRHLKVGRAYGLPCVSMEPSLYRAVREGFTTVPEISPDGLHPNDLGHRLIADSVIYCLEEIYEHLSEPEPEPEPQALPRPLTRNRYEQSIRLQSYNSEPKGSGFVKDLSPQKAVSKFFKNGWTSAQQGASLTFSFEGTGIAVQYRKSVAHPAPVALAVVDGDEEHAVRLDANFEEAWGDCLFLSTVAKNLLDGEHHLEVRLIEVPEHPAAEFYLVSVIVSKG
ncbi:GDSL-like Lipase/Acylhydrolase family protein [Caprobacter fermentans]|uniref:GDSL-like Lipase/Acylhydrolase family protein n=1 Tax=Caproicibacter fermentans TaxID=2576756 RepID=A0A6N8I2N5_9FIRM|nr:SGNH/GDSL hydrolase family protein [Caproicibacter fermentans]MVB12396.1 GDSL-like Lipase/Acylhydrolase family protein [Caproicibacter fermentans]